VDTLTEDRPGAFHRIQPGKSFARAKIHDMKDKSSSPFEQVKSGFWKAIGGTIATGLLIGLWELLVKYTRIFPGLVMRWVESLIPQGKAAATISRDLWIAGFSLSAVSFLFVFWRENKYVSHMYMRRDAFEAGKIKPTDLTEEEFHFIHSHWPELFQP
jgi:hypothetical protein